MTRFAINGRQMVPALGLMLLATGAVVIEGSRVDALILLVSLSALMVCMLPAVLQKTYQPYEPLTFVIASVLMGCTLKAFYLVFFYGSNETIDGKLLLNLNIDVLVFGSLVLLCGITFFTLGYCYAGSLKFGRTQVKNSSWSYRKIVGWSAVVTAISALSFIVFAFMVGASINGLEGLSAKRFRDDDGAVTASRSGSVDYLLYRLALLAKLPLYLLFIVKLKRGFAMLSVPGLLLFVAGFLSVFVPFFVNNRAGILLPLVDVGIITLMILGRLNLKLTAIVTVIGLSSVVVGGLLRSEADLGGFYDQIFGGRYLIDLTKTAHIVNAYASGDNFLHGITLISWIFQVIPFLEHPKPEMMNVGFYLGYEVFGYVASGVPPGVIAELFINFNWVGVSLGMLLIGFLLKAFYMKFGTALNNSEYVLIYALASTRLTIFLFNNGVSIALLKTALDLIALLGIFVLIRTKVRTRQAAAPQPIRRPTTWQPHGRNSRQVWRSKESESSLSD